MRPAKHRRRGGRLGYGVALPTVGRPPPEIFDRSGVWCNQVHFPGCITIYDYLLVLNWYGRACHIVRACHTVRACPTVRASHTVGACHTVGAFSTFSHNVYLHCLLIQYIANKKKKEKNAIANAERNVCSVATSWPDVASRPLLLGTPCELCDRPGDEFRYMFECAPFQG